MFALSMQEHRVYPVAFKLTALALSLCCHQAIAQQQQDQELQRSIEVINVTATRQTENLQDVPIAITALSASELEKMQIMDLGDLESHIPNLNLHVGDASNAVIYIRGVGQIDSISFNDPGVGVYLDDVYMGRVQGSFLDVVDPQQIEVLRGPQGTLYGRNTIGGAVKFTSAKPTQDTEGYVGLNIGNYNHRGLKASISGPLMESKLAGRFAIAKTDRDGYADNLFDEKEDYDKDSLAWRGSLLYTPSEQFNAYLVIDGSDNSPDRSRTPHRETPIYSVVSDDYRQPGSDPFTVNANYNDLEQLETQGAALTLEYQVGNMTLKSISAYREMEYRTHLDLDGTPDSSFGIYNFEDQHQVSQELQLLYRTDNLSLVSGLYYFSEDDLTFGGAVAPDFFVPLGNDVFLPFPVINAGERDQQNSSRAIYANLSMDLTDALGLTLGARYTKEKKQVISAGEEFAGTGIDSAEQMEAVFGTGIGYGQTGFSAEQQWSNFSPKLVLDYKASADTLLYASASKGFKSGGFNGRLTSFAQPFDPETLWSYEIGSKSLLNQQNVRLNLAAFYNDYKNFQLSRFSIDADTGAFLSLFENAGKATIYGGEMELSAVISDALTLNLNAGYLGGGYDELIGDFEQEVSDQRELVNAPKWNGRAALEYWFNSVTSGSLSLNASVSYRSKTYLTVSSSEILAQGGYSLVDVSLNYLSDQDWQASLYVNNLTDKRYRHHAFDLSASPGVQLGYYGAPRTFGINFTYRF
ncbi:TonB-dependent receptor [Lacimicrobium alkaliphilum]|uniref:TonB-dependent receptor n=1 Tax=Lacimicrobium alkaliphilum TaxID=1526571 RepID=A0ABQ1RF33_9ALTE|nr:TonB-dependent receptor [Lacimicrobium alkaliphilum]GGD66048.1 TonB-dependent receptor [Lacimicrobium alkaliphilum]